MPTASHTPVSISHRHRLLLQGGFVGSLCRRGKNLHSTELRTGVGWSNRTGTDGRCLALIWRALHRPGIFMEVNFHHFAIPNSERGLIAYTLTFTIQIRSLRR